MRKDRFYLPEIEKTTVVTDKAVIHKIKNVLRKGKGDSIYGFTGRGKELILDIESINSKRIDLSVSGILKEEKKKSKVSLAFSLLKSKKTDFIFSKGTEVGIDVFYPFISQRTDVKYPRSNKVEHWMKIVVSSTAQSQRLFMPEVYPVKGLDELISDDFMRRYGHVLVGSLESKDDIIKVCKDKLSGSAKDILLMVGPEGGFTPDEINKIDSYENSYKVNISDNVLRAETASVVLPAIVNLFVE